MHGTAGTVAAWSTSNRAKQARCTRKRTKETCKSFLQPMFHVLSSKYLCNRLALRFCGIKQSGCRILYFMIFARLSYGLLLFIACIYQRNQGDPPPFVFSLYYNPL
jgi:hypothetical protein